MVKPQKVGRNISIYTIFCFQKTEFRFFKKKKKKKPHSKPGNPNSKYVPHSPE